ncbi:hypothetical protein LY76DRAFT_172678 [Colletotrichum caudatum]|nr:hypothetical protein LY76DRAFT_172678 [Colletotrichum caudatum]
MGGPFTILGSLFRGQGGWRFPPRPLESKADRAEEEEGGNAHHRLFRKTNSVRVDGATDELAVEPPPPPGVVKQSGSWVRISHGGSGCRCCDHILSAHQTKLGLLDRGLQRLFFFASRCVRHGQFRASGIT